MRLLDLYHQVKGTLRWQRGGTGNAYGWAPAVVERLTNREGSAIPRGTLVQREGSGRIEVASGLDSTDVLGVVVGYWTATGLLVAGDCPEDTQCAVMVKGRARLLVDESVSGGEYAYQSGSTAGSARGDGSAGVGAFGVFDVSGTAGDLVYCHLFGSPLLSAGASSPLTTKGDIWGFDTVDARVPVGADGKLLTANSGDAQGVDWQSLRRAAVIELYAPSNGQQVDVRFPWAGTLAKWGLFGDASGSIVCDLWKDTYANYPPTVADTMVGGGGTKPTLSAATKNESSSLGAWTTTAIAAGDILRVNVDSTSGLTRATLVLEVTTP